MNYSNNGFSVLAGAVAPGDAVITLAAGTGARFPASDFLVTLVGYDELGNENKWEICKCSSRAGDALTVTRAQEGTTASAWPGATRIENRVTAGTMADLEPKIAAGTSAQYLRGDKTWRDFFTDVRAATLAGLSTASGAAITAADTVLSALGRLQRQLTDHIGIGGAAHPAATTTTAGFLSESDKTKLDGIAANANNYTHPANHPPSIITQDSDNRFVTDAEKAAWSGKQDALTSGGNIKTVNGVSLLGSGNVAVGDVTLGGAQTLTNKTLTAPVVNVVTFPGQVNAGNSGTAATVNFANGQKQTLTLTGNATVTLQFPGVGNYQLLLTQDATGGRTVTWSGVSRYVGSATAPAINTSANGSTMVSLYYDGANVWLAASKVNA